MGARGRARIHFRSPFACNREADLRAIVKNAAAAGAVDPILFMCELRSNRYRDREHSNDWLRVSNGTCTTTVVVWCGLRAVCVSADIRLTNTALTSAQPGACTAQLRLITIPARYLSVAVSSCLMLIALG